MTTETHPVPALVRPASGSGHQSNGAEPDGTSARPEPSVREEAFAGHRCLRLSNGVVSAWVTLDAGPRVLGFALDDGPEAGPLAGVNAFADDVRTTLEWPGGGTYRLRGGHRLWLAPEDPSETYRPDDDPPEVEVLSGGDAPAVRLSPPPHPTTGVRVALHVALLAGRAEAAVSHHVSNDGRDPVRLAPWAITQLPTGGTAVVPVSFRRADDFGVLPDRRLVLWPYTRLGDDRLSFGHYALVRADADAPAPIKIGTGGVGEGSGPGWLAYARPGAPTFVKRAVRDTSATYPDGGCSAEVYAGPAFCELETLGPLTRLAPNASAVHVERWSLHDAAPEPTTDDDAHVLAAALGLTDAP